MLSTLRPSGMPGSLPWLRSAKMRRPTMWPSASSRIAWMYCEERVFATYIVRSSGDSASPFGLAQRHAAIEKAEAFPVSDTRLGERVCLAVVTRGDMQVDPGALLEHLDASGLSRYDMPEFMLQLSEMPLTASGKLLKRELVRRAAEGELQPFPVRFVSRSAVRG